MLSKWDDLDYTALFTLFVPIMGPSFGKDVRDQRMSITLNYLFEQVGFEIYLEWARNDYSPNIEYLIRYPFHTQAYTVGASKAFSFSSPQFKGELFFEITNLESSRDYESIGATTFYAHHLITQGHTNRGQWIGAGMGTGGNSQYLGFTLYHPLGYSGLFVHRQNVNNDYIWFSNMGQPISDKRENEYKLKSILSGGIRNYINIFNHFGITTDIIISKIGNPQYVRNTQAWNFHVALGVKSSF
jgi:hypothetical protein